MFSFGFEPFERRLGPPSDPPDPTAPGPMAFADPDRLRSLLSGAGWESISIDPFDFTCDFTRLGGDGVEERISTVLGSSGGRRARSRLVPEVGPEGWAAVVDEVRALLRDNLVDGGVRFPGACWLVRGRNTDANSGID
jgi:hypothetical protein